jgi:hypothetical protein
MVMFTNSPFLDLAIDILRVQLVRRAQINSQRT